MNLPDIIKNVDNVYSGDLTHYYKVTWEKATNLFLPYHNYRHVFHVVWHCYDAVLFYRHALKPRDARNLLIAALFHDFNHPGRSGNDDLNIEVACRALTQNAHPSDIEHLEYIKEIIKTTQFPYVTPASDLILLQAILRDADVSQALSSSWVQHVIFGLAQEMRLTPLQVFKMQESFLSNLSFSTLWGQKRFPCQDINDKIEEARAHIAILES